MPGKMNELEDREVTGDLASDDAAISVKTADNEGFQLRSYQDEMLEESLKRNTVVVLDTGAGKTHIAIARIRAELESSRLERLVWFLAPTVALCHQHYRSFVTNLPAYQLRILTSEDDVDRWTDQATWDRVLQNIRIVISTYGVLYDTLCHGFVKMARLSLCVFDEAHHCTKKHPSNMIMQQFYRPAKAVGLGVPKILGLSASPVMNAKAGGLETLETNLDSRAATPRLHRSELMQYVHVPELTKRVYPGIDDLGLYEGSLLAVLEAAIRRYDIRNDPYVVDLVKGPGSDIQEKLNRILMSRKTYCTNQLNALRLRAEAVAKNVGLAASDTYIQACRDKFLNGLRQNNQYWMPDLTDKEKSHLARILAGVYAVPGSTPRTSASPKAELLLEILKAEAGSSFTGIVFVDQRAVVAALAEYLTSLPEIAGLFNIGTFVGGSNHAGKKANIGDINDMKEQQQTLDDFRAGKKNLIIATSVLEEGIDVSSCQTVVCFDAPLNLVSFVQRRGRARKKGSKYVVLLAEDDEKGEPSKWQDLEGKMKVSCEVGYRNAQLALQLENTTESNGNNYKVPSTGALLTLDNAKSHVYHFCSTLHTSGYIDIRPTFQCRTDAADLVTAEIILPACVNMKYRKAISKYSWRTERAAVKDAAFEACIALHRGGLLNDNLLPLAIETPDQTRQDRPGLIQVAKRVNPWSLQISESWHEHVVDVKIEGQAKVSMIMLLPVQCPQIPDIVLHWSPLVKGIARVRHVGQRTLDGDALTEGRRISEVLLRSAFPSMASGDNPTDYAAMFGPVPGDSITHFSGEILAATDVLTRDIEHANIGLVRVKGQPGRAYVLKESARSSDSTPISEPDQQLRVTTFPKKRDFLGQVAEISRKDRAADLELLASDCTVDALPVRYAFFAACIPSILHRVENAIVASHLQQTLLQPIGVRNLQLIVDATTSGAADPDSNYERLEYLGDAVLKFFTHVQLTSQYEHWPESYLTAEKGRSNGNASLSRAALKSGVDRYISTTRFTTNHWAPPYLSNALKQDDDEKVERSTKTLADVIEALIGASFVDQGFEGATACIRAFLPDEEWYGLAGCHQRLLSCVPESDPLSSLDTLQDLIGYKFNRPLLLLEAITHTSRPNNETSSYERLEFLGDAILDQIIVPEIFSHRRGLKNHDMHRMRQSLANSHFLGVCCMELSIEQERFEVDKGNNPIDPPSLTKTSKTLRLHDFLRCDTQMNENSQAALLRYSELRPRILEALDQGAEYPWPDLFALHPPKWFSDVIESVLGAVYIDSMGCLETCRAFLVRCGVLKYLHRFMDEDVAVGFPKERLGQLADREKIEYVTRKVENEVEIESAGIGKWGSEVWIGERRVGGVENCCSREEAEVRVAGEAVRSLLEERKGCGREDVVGEGGGREDVQNEDVEMVDVV